MTPPKLARDRVLDAAEDLFYREGVRAVGIDTIIARSGVAKMSLYRSFASKDDLVVAYLEARNRRFFEGWDRAVAEAGADPRDRLRALIRATLARVLRPEYRGCPFLNTSAEFPDPAHPARAVIEGHRAEVRKRLLELCRGVDPRSAESLAAQWVVLMNGIYASSGTIGEAEGQALLQAAETLIAARRRA